MPKKTQRDTVRDISQLATAYLGSRQPQARTREQQIAQHKAEIQRLLELAAVIEQAMTALVFRSYATPDREMGETLQHNRADLQRYKDELDSLRSEHEYALERLQGQE